MKKLLDDSADTILDQENDILKEAKSQLEEYFQRKRIQFDIPLDLRGSAFQLRVWQKLQDIPFGKTWSYQQLAMAIGNRQAVRAVGKANSQNPIPIIVPCHRVIEKSGKLGGFRAGLHIKDWLLSHEGYLL